jgi:flagellin-specific chaperone FliS
LIDRQTLADLQTAKELLEKSEVPFYEGMERLKEVVNRLSRQLNISEKLTATGTDTVLRTVPDPYAPNNKIYILEISEIQRIARKLKSQWREVSRGGCHILSEENCECQLCLIDKLRRTAESTMYIMEKVDV